MILAPSERVVVDVLFDEPGELTLEHRTPGARLSAGRDHRRRGARPSRRSRREFEDLRTNAEMVAERERIAPYLEPSRTRRSRSSPRWTWASRSGPVVYACPMHPEVVSDEPGTARSAG